MIAFVHGPDALLTREFVRDLVRERDPDNNATSRVDGRTTSPGQIATMAGTPGFFGMGRVIVVDDLFAARSRAAKAAAAEEEDGSGAPPPSKDALAVLSAVSPDNLLILAEPSLASVPAAVKKAAPGILVRAGTPPRGGELIAWITARAKADGAEIDRAAAEAIADAICPVTWKAAPTNPRYDVPPDLDRIAQEVRKLAVYAHPGPIRRAHVEEMTASATADQLFPFIEALFAGRTDATVNRLRDVLDRGDDLFRVLAQAMQHIELATPLEAGSGRPPEAIGKDLGVSNQRRMIPIERASRANPATPLVAAAVQADRDQKQGRLHGGEDVLAALLVAAGARRRPERNRG